MAYFAPPGYQPQCNPIMPYLGPLSLRPGMSVYIHGVIPHHITRFEVDLQCGEFEGTDIALHFNPRFDGWDKVVFNTFRDGCWEGEERVREMPFRKGESFELIIIASAEGYQINVNGRQFYMFQHRVPLERVSALRIQGDVTLETLNIIGGDMQDYPSGGMGGMGVSVSLSSSLFSVILKLHLPISISLLSFLFPSLSLFLKAARAYSPLLETGVEISNLRGSAPLGFKHFHVNPNWCDVAPGQCERKQG
ncbi:galectin-7-like isoform X1 [Amia ocellicauda]|uniref:galectin-7-like isoform X1 n=1 Tax=Amia ocellicauda TaxID=2972642 RepID=UPI0034643E55